MNRSNPARNTDEQAVNLGLADGELERVEAKIAEVLGSREPRITRIAEYLIHAGGKRVRPAVAMLIFRACGGRDITDMVDLCVSLELIHSATLLHDDIIDSSDTRRGKEAAPVRFGVADTLVTGDFLFSRAFELCGRFEADIVTWAADACIQLTEGEILQGRFRRNTSVTMDNYMEIINRKTASLFSAGARIAAYMAGCVNGRVQALAECGRQIGLAFQMIDDVLDVDGDASRLGKQTGTDLRDGNPSLPIVLALDVPAVREAFTTGGCPGQAVEKALDALRRARIPQLVRDRAIEHARRASDLIATLEAGPYREALGHLVAELVQRDI